MFLDFEGCDRPRVHQSVFSQLKTLSCERSRAQRMLWLLWFETWETRRKINVSPSIIFHNIIKVVRQFDLVKKINTLRQAILTSLLLFGRSTVGSPAPPPLWLVRWLESDRDERSVLSKVEHSSTRRREKNARREKDAQRSARSWRLKKKPFRTIEKICQSRGKKRFGEHAA